MIHRLAYKSQCPIGTACGGSREPLYYRRKAIGTRIREKRFDKGSCTLFWHGKTWHHTRTRICKMVRTKQNNPKIMRSLHVGLFIYVTAVVDRICHAKDQPTRFWPGIENLTGQMLQCLLKSGTLVLILRMLCACDISVSRS